jgi:glucose-1-phosphate cytidylyltransferase
VFDHLEEGCDLIGDVCAPLAKDGRMMAFRHRGFWHPADTVKERTALEAAYQSGTRPWMLWDAPDRDPLQAAIAELSGRLDR